MSSHWETKEKVMRVFFYLQVPFPMGVNVRPRPNKNRATTSEENSQESPRNLPNEELFFNGDSASCSVKESDWASWYYLFVGTNLVGVKWFLSKSTQIFY